MNTNDGRQHAILRQIAHRVMRERGLEPDFSPAALAQVAGLAAAAPAGDGVRDLRALPWCSIDNDDSTDLDQLSVAEPATGVRVQVLVAVADVDALVEQGVGDRRARPTNTTSVYTAAGSSRCCPRSSRPISPRSPTGQDRLAVVVEMHGRRRRRARSARTSIRAAVHNHAKLAYDAVAAWLDGTGAGPDGARRGRPDSTHNLRMQDGVAQRLRESRSRARRPRVRDDRGAVRCSRRTTIRGPAARRSATAPADLIEDFMIAANGVTARFLAAKELPSLRRVVRTPKRWERIVEVAAHGGEPLPAATRRQGARLVPRQAAGRRPGALPRPLAHRHQAAGRRRVRRRASRRRMRPATSASRSRTTPTPLRPIAVSPTSSRSACSRPRSPGAPPPYADGRAGRARRRTARSRRTPPTRSSARCAKSAAAMLLASADRRAVRRASSPAPPRRARGCGCSNRRSRDA